MLGAFGGKWLKAWPCGKDYLYLSKLNDLRLDAALGSSLLSPSFAGFNESFVRPTGAAVDIEGALWESREFRIEVSDPSLTFESFDTLCTRPNFFFLALERVDDINFLAEDPELLSYVSARILSIAFSSSCLARELFLFYSAMRVESTWLSLRFDLSAISMVASSILSSSALESSMMLLWQVKLPNTYRSKASISGH